MILSIHDNSLESIIIKNKSNINNLKSNWITIYKYTLIKQTDYNYLNYMAYSICYSKASKIYTQIK